MNQDEFDWSPCLFIQYEYDLGEPYFGLIFDKFEGTQPSFEATGLEADGYTWRRVVEALIQTHGTKHAQALSYDPESSMFCARSSNIDSLKEVHYWICFIRENTGFLKEIWNNLASDLNQ